MSCWWILLDTIWCVSLNLSVINEYDCIELCYIFLKSTKRIIKNIFFIWNTTREPNPTQPINEQVGSGQFWQWKYGLEEKINPLKFEQVG